MTETLYTTDTPMQRLAGELADAKKEGLLRATFSVLDVEAVIAASGVEWGVAHRDGIESYGTDGEAEMYARGSACLFDNGRAVRRTVGQWVARG